MPASDGDDAAAGSDPWQDAAPPSRPLKQAAPPDMFGRLLLPAGAEGWEVVATMEGGAVATRLLDSNARLRLWDFAEEVLADPDGRTAGADRLASIRLDAMQPDAMLAAIEAAGMRRQVDAVIALDAALHADTSRLLGWWINAGLVLKPGGRIVMTLADPTTAAGFPRILRDIRRFWRFQGRPCQKLGFQSREIATTLLTALGFEVERLEPWSPQEGRPPRDLCLVARLVHPGQAETFRPALYTDMAEEKSPRSEGFAEYWTRQSARALAADTPLRPDGQSAYDRLLANAEAEAWSHAIEIGLGDARYTAEALAASPALRLLGFDVSPPVLEAAAARLAPEVATGRLALHRIDPAQPDGLLRVVEQAGLAREIDAVFSIDAMVHVGLQYQLAYWISAALVLKPGGWLILSVADATSPGGFARLVTDLPAAYRARGRPGSRLDYLSPAMVKTLLELCGFEVPYIWNWNPADGGDEGRDLYVLARLARPDQAEALRPSLVATPTAAKLDDAAAAEAGPAQAAPRGAPGETNAGKARDMAESQNDETIEIARALGQAYWRQLQIQQNPDIPREVLRDRMREQWPANRREYTKVGQMVLRQLANMGFTVNRTGTGKDGGTT